VSLLVLVFVFAAVAVVVVYLSRVLLVPLIRFSSRFCLFFWLLFLYSPVPTDLVHPQCHRDIKHVLTLSVHHEFSSVFSLHLTQHVSHFLTFKTLSRSTSVHSSLEVGVRLGSSANPFLHRPSPFLPD